VTRQIGTRRNTIGRHLFVPSNVICHPSQLNVHGDAADQWGTYRQIAGEKGKAKRTFRGRYVALRQKGSDGKWRIERLMMQPLPEETK